MSSVPSSTAAVGYLQQFIQFPRGSVPRTILYCAVANYIFFQFSSQLARYIEQKRIFPSVRGESIACNIVVVGGLTALFNILQFRFFNYQLWKLSSLAIGVFFVCVAILGYAVKFHSEANIYARQRELLNNRENHTLLAQAALGVDGVAAIMVALRNRDGYFPNQNSLIGFIDSCFSRQLLPVLSFPRGKDQILCYIASELKRRNLVPVSPRQAGDYFNEIFTEVINNPPEELRHLIVLKEQQG